MRSSAEPARTKCDDVGDVDAQAPVALLVARQRDRVVEVARRRRVDRHGQDVAEVEPAADLGFVEQLGLLAGLVEDRLVEGVGDVERADDREGVDPRLPAPAEDLGDDALALEVGRRVADHLEGDLVARPGPLGAGVADVDRLVERRAVDLDEAGAPVLEVGADEDPRGPRQDLDDPALGVHAAAASAAW